MKSASNRTLILVNPQARNGQLGKEWAERDKAVFEALGESATQLVFTTEQDHGEGLVRKALQSGTERILVVGGDGTLSEAVQGFFHEGQLVNPKAVLLLLPAGRGDDFFKVLADRRFYTGSSAWSRGLELLKNGTPHPVDVGRIQWLGSGEQKQRYFINIVSFGFPGLVVQKVHGREGLLGKSFLGKSALAYGLQGISALREYQPVAIQVKVDGKEFYKGKIHSGFTMNGRYNGGGICWDSEAQFDDGLFQLLIMEPRNQLNALIDSTKIILGKWNGIQGLHRIQGKKIEVLMSEEELKLHHFFEIDGDLTEAPTTRGAIFEMLPGAIQVQLLNK